METEVIALSEVKETQKDKYYFYSLVETRKSIPTEETNERVVSGKGEGGEG